MTNQMIDFEFMGTNAIVSTDDVAFTYESNENPRDFDKFKVTTESLDWTDRDYLLGEFSVFPYGTNNDLPKIIKDVVQNNYIAPGILKKQTGLLWGKGPKLYEEKFDDGVLVRVWKDDTEIQDWMDSWDADIYLHKSCVDYHYIQGTLTKMIRDRAARLGKQSKIAKLEHMNMNQGRLGRKGASTNRDATHCIYTIDQYERTHLNADYKVYPLLDPRDPFKHSNSVLYSNMYSFCSDHYSVPDIFGSLEWLRRSTAIPLILKALSKNSMNLKYHVISPQMFWDQKRKELENLAKEKKENFVESDLIKYKKRFLDQISKTLSNVENTGKFWHSVKHIEVEGNNILEQGWEIKPLDQKILDFVKAQETVSNISNRSVAAGLGVHQALGGSGEPGKTDGGGEQLYALKNYLATGIDIPEMIVCKAINYAIKANWPSKNLKVGFYHIEPQREQDITSKERFKEKV